MVSTWPLIYCLLVCFVHRGRRCLLCLLYFFLVSFFFTSSSSVPYTPALLPGLPYGTSLDFRLTTGLPVSTIASYF